MHANKLSSLYHFSSLLYRQILHIIKNAKKAIHDEARINTMNFQHFLEQMSPLPDDDDQTFVLDYETEIKGGKPNLQKLNETSFNFTCILTTKRLLRNIFDAKVFHADSTYKLNWMGFPVHIFGISDLHRAFHPIAIGFSTNESKTQFAFCFKAIRDGILNIFNHEIHFEAFISDASQALRNAVAEHFPDFIHLQCWFHKTQKRCSSIILPSNGYVQHIKIGSLT